MNKATNDFLKLLILVFVLPVVILSLVLELPGEISAELQGSQSAASTQAAEHTQLPSSSTASAMPSDTYAPTEPIPTVPDETDVMATQPPAEAAEQTIWVNRSGLLEEMALEEYLLGVVLAEMPASFHIEALKAQAVASRSYALVGSSGGGNHPEGYVCTSAACCQAYQSPEEYIRAGGSWEHIQKVSDAISQTKGEVLTYEGKLVLATYFSCSGGSTEAAITVFGVDYPYLQSVDSPGEEFASVYYDSITYTPEEFAEALSADLSGNPSRWIGEMTYTQGGGIHSVRIGNATYDGLTVKALLGLRSTIFTIRVTDAGICVETQGYGHRVGMSQYGAQAMAQEGSSYLDILLHYYVGTTLAQSAVIF